MKDHDIIDLDRWGRRVPTIEPRTIRMAVAGVLMIAALFTTFYQVQPEEVGVVLRLGRY